MPRLALERSNAGLTALMLKEVEHTRPGNHEMHLKYGEGHCEKRNIGHGFDVWCRVCVCVCVFASVSVCVSRRVPLRVPVCVCAQEDLNARPHPGPPSCSSGGRPE